ncbi:hypothetical protein WJX72_002505 [[Myrmecia] bisecta]|uniref:Manganese-dependent ADP-ribose/CDP-alcohol diphosphatase n=1 Tax=[Myrmecia] bisecta TaxID=41462 RepID=A0AAW1P6U7_9CHLO
MSAAVAATETGTAHGSIRREEAQASVGATTNTGACNKLFSFGIMSDVQYADIPDGHSFHGIPRYYRGSKHALHRGVTGWIDQDVDFGMHFGDLIDGYQPKSESRAVLQALKAEFARLGKPVYHMLGNHCLYNLPREELNTQLGISGVDGGSYYSFSPHPRWRFVVLDGYEVSVLGWPAGHPLHEQAKRILDERNPHENKNSPEGLVGVARRFVRFGGGVSAQQVAWLQHQLADAKAEGQRVIVCCHLPLHPDTCLGTCLLWNYDEVLKVLQGAGNVAATFAGHIHDDAYALDETGIHHRVVNAILETPPGRDCYGWVDVYQDRLECTGVDNMQSYTLPLNSQPVVESSSLLAQRSL